MAKEELPEVGRLHGTEKEAETPTNERPKPKVVSVYLSNKDKRSLDEIAQKKNIDRNMLLSYAIRYFLANYRAGNIKLDPTIEAGKVVLNINLDLENIDA
jgi:predicted transcriptional regulator